MRSAIAIVVAAVTLSFGYGVLRVQARGEVPGLESIQMIDALTGWAVTVTREPGNAFLRTSDGGTHWKDVTPFDSSGQRILVGNVDVLTSLIAWVGPFRTVDGGRTWRNGTMSALGWIRSVHFINPRDGWLLSVRVAPMGGENADIYHSTDGGKSWIKLASTRADDESSGLPFGGSKLDVTFLNATTGWVTGIVNSRDWLYLYVTHDGGRMWRQQNLLLPPRVVPHWDDKTMPPKFFTARDGVLPVYYSSYDPTSYALVVFYATHDAGKTWVHSTPVSIAQPSKWYSTLSFADVNHGWVLDGDALYVTSDGGYRWTTIRPSLAFGGADVRQLDFISPQVGWAVSQTFPFLLKTQDGGHTWTPVAYTVSRQ